MFLWLTASKNTKSYLKYKNVIPCSTQSKVVPLTAVQQSVNEDKPQKLIAEEDDCSQSATSKHINRRLRRKMVNMHQASLLRNL